MSPSPPPKGKVPGPTALKEPAKPHPLLIHLDLAELIDLNEVQQDSRSGLLRAGPVFHSDPDRPALILQCILAIFFPLLSQLRIELGHGAGAGRFLRALFLWAEDEGDRAGVSAMGLTRTTLSTKWQLKDAVRDRGVTAYIFEGAIAHFIQTHLAGVTINASNVFGTFAAHELGHNLGLEHELSPDNVMFVYQDQPASAQKKWLEAASAGKLRFTSDQIFTMMKLLEKP